MPKVLRISRSPGARLAGAMSRRKLRPSYKEWLIGFDSYMEQTPHARRALEQLEAKGCDRGILLRWVYAHTGMDREGLQGLGARFFPHRHHLERVAKLLDEAAMELEKLQANPFWPDPETVYFLQNIRRPNDPALPALKHASAEFAALPKILTRNAALLRSTRVEITARAFSYRQLWKHLPLAVLAHYIKRQTGSWKYGAIAHLLEAAEWGLGNKSSVAEENIKKQHERFLKSKNGRLYSKFFGFDSVLKLFASLDRDTKNT